MMNIINSIIYISSNAFFTQHFYRRKMCKIIEFKKRLKIDDDEIKN